MSAQIPEGYVACQHCCGMGVIEKPAKTSLHFAAFWSSWPAGERKQDKAACLRMWKDRNYDRIADRIGADVAVKQQTQKWRDGFVEAPRVYLNNRRWEDGVVADDLTARLEKIAQAIWGDA